MEKIVANKIRNYLGDLISNNQSGFLPNHSTVTQLVEIYDDIVQSLDKQQEVQFIFLYIQGIWSSMAQRPSFQTKTVWN